MAVAVTIPKATLSLEEASVIAWRKAPGDPVEKGETLFEMETDKVVVEVPAPAAGYLLRIDVAEGIARVEQTVGWIGEPGEAVETIGVQPPARPAATAAIPRAHGAESQPGAATPAARRRARELRVDVSRIQGTGPGGRITERDVESFAGGSPTGEQR
jgi:pyruvate/2-oxoglutarate dehydrogenase complex dihydrolipoamide acyltransferase (E2) component